LQAPHARPDGEGMASRRIGVGIVGYGLAGRVFHSTLIRHVPTLEVVAVVTRDDARRANAASDHPDAHLHDTSEALFADERVEVVVIATPHDTHLPLTLAATASGKHVICDKVMCLNADEGEQMCASAEAAGVLLSVFQNRRWDADFLTVQDVLARGLVGEPFVIESCVTGYRLTPGYKLPSGDLPRAWRTYAEFGGGPFRDWGAHLLDQAVQLAGDHPVRVHADFQYRRDWNVETAGTALVTYAGPEGRIGDGLRYVIEVGNISAIARPRWYIRGSEGAYLQYGRDAQEAALHRGEVGPRPMDPENAPRLVRDVNGTMQDVPIEGKSGNYLAYYENVAAAILGEAPLAVTGRSVLPSIRIIDAALRSAATGSVVMPAVAHA
jgi:scyllo-inositol 2-dehydrogenase (NADP+)